MKNSLNFVSTCLKVVDTRRISPAKSGFRKIVPEAPAILGQERAATVIGLWLHFTFVYFDFRPPNASTSVPSSSIRYSVLSERCSLGWSVTMTPASVR